MKMRRTQFSQMYKNEDHNKLPYLLKMKFAVQKLFKTENLKIVRRIVKKIKATSCEGSPLTEVKELSNTYLEVFPCRFSTNMQNLSSNNNIQCHTLKYDHNYLTKFRTWLQPAIYIWTCLQYANIS